jgi:hypothetical protein
MITSLRIGLAASLVTVASLGGRAIGQTENTPVIANKALAQACKLELSNFKAVSRQDFEMFSMEIMGLLDQVALGTLTPQQALDGAVDAANELVEMTHMCVDMISRDLESTAAGILATPVGLPTGFLVGDTSTIDKFCASLDKAATKIRLNILKELREFAIGLDAGEEYVVASSVPALVKAPLPAPNPTPNAPLPEMLLSINSLVGGSDRTVAGDGRLGVAGTADPSNGDVTVTINGPNGTTATQTVSVDAATGMWHAFFPAAGPDNLPEGNYRVEAKQGDANGASVNGAVGIPGLP